MGLPKSSFDGCGVGVEVVDGGGVVEEAGVELELEPPTFTMPLVRVAGI